MCGLFSILRTVERLAEGGVISFPQIEEKPTAGRSLAEGGVIQLPQIE